MATSRKFSRDFKLKVVKMVKNPHLAAKQVARDLYVNANTLPRWIRELSEESLDVYPGRKSTCCKSNL